jgi:large subunit ribosomal protein L23
MKDATEIIVRPLMTEKTTFLQRLGKYTFEVTMDATKVDVQRAIEQLGRCEVEKVNTLVVKGKVRRTRRGTGRTSDWKKAVVTLKDGEALGGVLGQAFETV